MPVLPRFPIALSTIRSCVSNEIIATFGINCDYELKAAELNWEDTWRTRNLPIAFAWGESDWNWQDNTQPIPDEVLQQLIGQTIGAGIKFSYGDKNCYCINIDIPSTLLGKRISKKRLAHIRWLTAVDASLIDMSK